MGTVSGMTPEERARDRYLRTTYGITLTEYNVILEHQGGVCAVCRKPPKPPKPGKKARHLHVDHDHRTGKTRGLLCFTCNFEVVGKQRDPELLRAAARYLERPPADEALLAV